MEPAEYEYRVERPSNRDRALPKRCSGRKRDYSVHWETPATRRPERNRRSQTLFHEHRGAWLKELIRELEDWGFPVRVDMLQQMVNSIADVLLGQQEPVGGRKKLDSCLDSQRASVYNLDIITDWFVFSERFSNATRLTQRAGIAMPIRLDWQRTVYCGNFRPGIQDTAPKTKKGEYHLLVIDNHNSYSSNSPWNAALSSFASPSALRCWYF